MEVLGTSDSQITKSLNAWRLPNVIYVWRASRGAHQGRRRHDTARRRQRAQCIGKPKYREPRIDIVLRSWTGGHKIRCGTHLTTVGLERISYDYREGHRHAMVLEAGANCRN
jgi:hypothetical protein